MVPNSEHVLILSKSNLNFASEAVLISKKIIPMEDDNLVFCKIVVIDDFNKICRCCLSQNPLGSIFEIMYEETPLDQIFYSLFGTQLDRTDDLPKKICETCVGKLICCHIFKKRFEASETVLRDIIPIKIEDADPETKSQHEEESVKDLEQCVEVAEDAEQSETKVKENLEPKSETGIKAKRKKYAVKFTCSCGDIFTSRLEFRQHRESTGHEIPRTHPCKICGKLFTKYNLWAHSRVHDDVKRFSCNYCSMSFAFSGNFRRHMMQHTGERPHLCELCGKGFIQRDSLVAHRRLHTGEKPYLCSTCGKCFRDRLTLNVHVRSHNRQKSSVMIATKARGSSKSDSTVTFVCEQCGRSFSRQAAYKMHLNKHGLGNEQIFEDDVQCTVCKKFYAAHSLYLHMMTHKNGQQFLCNICGKRCNTKSALTSHTLTHTGEKSLACEFCGKKFARSQSLQIHRYGHTGERPYACPSCPRKFRQSSHLTTHLKVHTGERPYVCRFCQKSFRQKGNFDIHVRTHTGEKPYKCDICNDTFHDSGSVRKHKQRKHQQVLKPAPTL